MDQTTSAPARCLSVSKFLMGIIVQYNMDKEHTFINVLAYSRPSSGSRVPHDPEEGLQQAETLTKVCSFSILYCAIISIKNLTVRSILRVPKLPSLSQIVNQQPLRHTTEIALGPRSAIGVFSLKILLKRLFLCYDEKFHESLLTFYQFSHKTLMLS